MKSIVVIPTYNEAENITALVPAIREAVPGIDVLVVDDGSPDGTADLAERLEGVKVLRRPGKMGLGTAYVTGFGVVLRDGYERIGMMDADFSHDPQVLPLLLGKLETHDVAIGSRYVAGGGVVNWGLHRRLLSKTANTLARTILSLRTPDVTTGFRAFRRNVLESIDLPTIKSEGYSFLVELVYRAQRAGFSIGEVPIVFKDREKGVSKMSVQEMRQGFLNLLKIRFQR